jgi:hypothetical protein
MKGILPHTILEHFRRCWQLFHIACLGECGGAVLECWPRDSEVVDFIPDCIATSFSLYLYWSAQVKLQLHLEAPGPDIFMWRPCNNSDPRRM